MLNEASHTTSRGATGQAELVREQRIRRSSAAVVVADEHGRRLHIFESEAA